MNMIFEWVGNHPFYTIGGLVILLAVYGLYRFAKERFEEFEFDEFDKE